MASTLVLSSSSRLKTQPHVINCCLVQVGIQRSRGPIRSFRTTSIRSDAGSGKRSPLDAEHQANTVRGDRAARSRARLLKEGHTPPPELASEGGSEQSGRRGAGSRGGGGSDDGNGSEGLFGRTARAWRSTPLIWKPIPILLGAGVLLLVQARRNYLADQEARRSKVVDGEGRIVSMSGPWTVYVLGALPLNAISRAWGWANNITLPVWFRPFGFRLYSRIFGCNLDEMQDPDLSHYKSLGEFFYRELKDGVRTIEEAPVVSPADGTVLHFGTIQGRRVEQVKGITYSLDALLGTSSEPQARDDFVGGLSQDGQGQSSDERRFADINGIAYSLDRLLGNEQLDADGKRRKSRWIFGPLASLTWWKSWLGGGGGAGNRSSETNAQTARAPLADRPEQIPSRREDGESFNGSPFTLSGPEEEAGIPTSDTPEILGRYANVAYEMGGGALPPILQRHSPGHDGIAQGNKLFFAVIYLAPGDYHHFHSPTAWVVERRRHFRGELYSVSPYVASRLSNLFVLNERVAMLGRWRHGFFGMIPVGATNVGSIVVSFDKALRTNVRDQRALAGTYSEASYSSASRLLGGQPLLPGQEMGGFRLGSTVVLVFEAPEEFAFTITPGQKIKLGAALGDFTPR